MTPEVFDGLMALFFVVGGVVAPLIAGIRLLESL